MLRRLLLTPALMVIAFPAAAGTFDDAVAALKRGDCDMAPKLMRDAAGQDNILAQFNLGAMYATGDCVPQDYAESAKWLRRAAEQGDAAAQTNLGAKYFKGEGVARDTVMAHMWFSLAADQGNATARANRDAIARDMPPWQIAEARRLAEEWKASHP